MKTLFFFVAFLMTTGSWAQSPPALGRVQLGFSSGAPSAGFEYEKRKSDVRSVGGYIFIQTEKEEPGIQQSLMLGVFAPLHLLPKNLFDFYVAPGFGLGMIEANKKNEMIIGPSLKIGIEQRIDKASSVGFQFSSYYNFFNSKLGNQADYAVLSYSFQFE